MSRIEEALRRARTVGAPEPPPEESSETETEADPDPSPWGTTPGDDARLDSPWAFDATHARPPRTAPEPPPVAAVESADTASPPHAPITHVLRPEALRHEPLEPDALHADPVRSAPLPDPSRRQRGLFKAFDPHQEPRIVGSREMPPASVEQYRRVAATLHQMQMDRGVKVVMVTSAVPGEGKSLTSTNLALTLSQSYRRHVLLIDGDLRRPSIHEIFQLKNLIGLSEALKAQDDRKLSIAEVSDHLSVLTAGKPNPDPMEGLTSERMRRIVAEAATTFDWVIIDTPPVALMPDAGLLAAMAEVAILVVGATKTPHAIIQRTVESLGRDKIMGVILNRADAPSSARTQYQSYYE